MKSALINLIPILFCLTSIGMGSDNFLRDDYIPDDFGRKTQYNESGSRIDPSDPIIASGDCSDYIDLSGLPLPISEIGTTVGATNNFGPFPERPPCWRGDWRVQSCAGPDVAFKWTAPVSSEYTISLCESHFDNCLLLYRFTCPAEPVYPDDFICGADNICLIRAKDRFVHFDEGEEVLIIVDGFGNNAGDFELRIYKSEIEDMDWFINSQIETFHVPGASACIVKDGQIEWTGSYGFANIEENIAVTENTLFSTASISKTITATALMQLWEEGYFQLDDDINDYLPFNVRNPNFPSTPITFRMLMTHMSSIRDCWSLFSDLRSWGEDSQIPLGEFMENYLVPGGDYFDPDSNYYNAEPGTESASIYSNTGAALTACLLEEISPDYDSFAQYCNENIFVPLEMNETSWYLSDLNPDNIAIPYRWDGTNQNPLGHYCDPWYPAASLRTSALELARHLISYMQYGRIDDIRLLDSTTVDMMMAIQYPDLRPRQGLYWYWYYAGLRYVFGHNGSYLGAECDMFFYPEENTGVIILTNGENTTGVGGIVNHLFEYAAGPSAIISGIVTDNESNPIDNVYAKIIGETRSDYSNPGGEYTIGGLITGTFDLRFRHRDYFETTIENVAVTTGETTYVNIIMEAPCDYVIGDYNGSGAFNVADIIAAFGKLKGQPNEPALLCECPYGGGNSWAVAMDLNASCNFNIADVIWGFGKLKGQTNDLVPCPDCPPSGR